MPFDSHSVMQSRLVGASLLPFNGVKAAGGISRDMPTEDDLSDWLNAVADLRDRGAFRSLFAYYAPRVKGYLVKQGCDVGMAEEVVQEVMTTIWRRAHLFDRTQAGASTWIFAIARNKRIDLIRRERRPELDPEDPPMAPSEPVQGDMAVHAAQSGERLRAAIGQLPDEQRRLIMKAFYEDKAHSEIAQEAGLPLGTVKSRIRLAMGRLRKELQES